MTTVAGKTQKDPPTEPMKRTIYDACVQQYGTISEFCRQNGLEQRGANRFFYEGGPLKTTTEQWAEAAGVSFVAFAGLEPKYVAKLNEMSNEDRADAIRSIFDT